MRIPKFALHPRIGHDAQHEPKHESMEYGRGW